MGGICLTYIKFEDYSGYITQSTEYFTLEYFSSSIEYQNTLGVKSEFTILRVLQFSSAQALNKEFKFFSVRKCYRNDIEYYCSNMP